MNGRAVPVSVVIPCFRCGATVGRALNSALGQTAPPAEIIIVDDSSDDDSGTRLVELTNALAAGPLIRTLRLPSNRGPASARNAGWVAASQPYIAFLDSDDAWYPEKLALQYTWMSGHPESVLTGHAIVDRIDSETTGPSVLRRAVAVTPAMLLLSNRFQTTSVMLRKNIVQRFAEGKRFCEDYLLWLEIVLAGGRTHYLDLPLARRFKPVYGKDGASARLWDMERGELDALKRVRNAGLLGAGPYGAAVTWSLLKFARRVLLPLGAA